MLFNKNDSQIYIQEFKKRFTNFCEKSPILVSYTTTPKGVQVVDESTNTVYSFEWDFTVPVKTFIFGIKSILIDKCYPRMIQYKEVSQELSYQEQVDLASSGISLGNLPTSKVVREEIKWLIEKVVVFKDIVILKNLDTGQMFRYRMNKSVVFFLKKMRSGQLTPEKAGVFFFANSELLNEIVPKSEQLEE